MRRLTTPCRALAPAAPQWRLARRLTLFVALATLGAIAPGCYSETVHFYTRFNQPGALAVGAPVVSLGTPIGSVASVTPGSNGGADVTLNVDRNDADNVRQDSIMVLSDNPSGPTVEVMSPNPSSPPADAGATIDGASSQQDANTIVAAKGLAAMAPAMAMILGAGGAGANPAAASALNATPAMMLLQAQIATIQAQYLAAGASGAASAAQQLAAVNQSASALEQQLVAAGHSAQADQLRKQIDNLARTLALAPGAAPAAGAVAPASGAATPAATGGSSTLEIPPAH